MWKLATLVSLYTKLAKMAEKISNKKKLSFISTITLKAAIQLLSILWYEIFKLCQPHRNLGVVNIEHLVQKQVLITHWNHIFLTLNLLPGIKCTKTTVSAKIFCIKANYNYSLTSCFSHTKFYFLMSNAQRAKFLLTLPTHPYQHQSIFLQS